MKEFQSSVVQSRTFTKWILRETSHEAQVALEAFKLRGHLVEAQCNKDTHHTYKFRILFMENKWEPLAIEGNYSSA